MSAAAAGGTAPLQPDLCIIGGGTAGIALATAAAAFGVPVVLIERHALGGRRLHGGGLDMLALAELARRPGAAELGAEAITAHLARSARAVAANSAAHRLAALGITVIAGEGRFRDRRTVEAAGQIIRPRRTVIATGSRPFLPEVPGLAALSPLTPADTGRLASDRSDVLILGSGGEAVTLAQALQRLGSAVTLVCGEGLLPGWDAEAVALLRRQLLQDGVALHEGAPLLRAQGTAGEVCLVLANRESGGEIRVGGRKLVLAGSAPATDGLEADLAGIAAARDGIAVDRHLRTANRRVLAIGSCAAIPGAARDSSASEHQAGLALRHLLFRLAARPDPSAWPRITPCQPEIAGVGLGTQEAATRGGGIRVLRWPYAENDRARAQDCAEGFVKVVTDRRGTVLGATIAGDGAGELIAPWALAVARRAKISEIAGLAAPPSSLSELSRRTALSFYAPLAANPRLRRLIGFLRRFG